ncbi:TlpA disulfide reductase family protein [Alkalihalobacillus sp. LMS39]|uniref:TlpA disulfide reductase family protein n=1 Tax=Alkalihalobacillus sp. LMS39 TaxID=2924032 RepID=UPI001FB36F39|nr:TlpA disulfide reductase family protein [Alkalihalobacillus sp. LMS39]UOE92280.1 TlpA family protein disulfide reductase [Alkalihalobacillus sp. LMS39]
MVAPPFSLHELHTNNVVSLADYKGKPVMLTFWASWCPDSMKDLHQKNQLFETMDKEKLHFLTVNVTGREGKAEDGPRYIQEQSYRFPVLLDEGTKTYDAYRCMGVPTTVLLNEKQEIIATYNDKSSFIDIMKGVSYLV